MSVNNNLTISNPLFLSLILLVILAGEMLLSNSVSILNVLFIIVAHTLVLSVIYRNGLKMQDWLNPLNVILLIGLIRFSLPFLLLQFGSPDIEIFDKMQVGYGENWHHANILALIGLLGVIAGWQITIRPSGPHRPRSDSNIPKSVAYIAVLGMLAGAFFLWRFIESNSTVGAAVLSGSFRGTEIQPGTGKYFHFALMLISSSVILSAYLARRNHVPYIVALLPVIVAMAFYFVLGGRTRAITPVLAGLFVVWYERENATFTPKNTFALFVLFVGLLMFYSGMVMYRARYGLEGFFHGLSAPGLMLYLRTAIWTEIGQLHSLAGAILIGPGVLGGVTFTKLLWPLSDILGVPGNSTGIYLAENLVGFHNDKRWGLHATLIGDAYVNFGLLGLFIVTVTFGVLLKYLYRSYRQRVLNSAMYALIFVYLIRIFFETIEKYSEFITIIAFAMVIFIFARLLGSTLKKA